MRHKYSFCLFSTTLLCIKNNDINTGILNFGKVLVHALKHCFYFIVICPWNGIRGHLLQRIFPVCLSVWQKPLNFAITFEPKDIDFIFGMRIQLMKPFQMTPGSMTL